MSLGKLPDPSVAKKLRLHAAKAGGITAKIVGVVMVAKKLRLHAAESRCYPRASRRVKTAELLEDEL